MSNDATFSLSGEVERRPGLPDISFEERLLNSSRLKPAYPEETINMPILLSPVPVTVFVHMYSLRSTFCGAGWSENFWLLSAIANAFHVIVPAVPLIEFQTPFNWLPDFSIGTRKTFPPFSTRA